MFEVSACGGADISAERHAGIAQRQVRLLQQDALLRVSGSRLRGRHAEEGCVK
jgi:hypothetical protein